MSSHGAGGRTSSRGASGIAERARSYAAEAKTPKAYTDLSRGNTIILRNHDSGQIMSAMRKSSDRKSITYATAHPYGASHGLATVDRSTLKDTLSSRFDLVRTLKAGTPEASVYSKAHATLLQQMHAEGAAARTNFARGGGRSRSAMAEASAPRSTRLTTTGVRPSERVATGRIPYAGPARVTMSAPRTDAGIKQAYANTSKARDALVRALNLHTNDVIPYFMRIRRDAEAASKRDANEFTHEPTLRKQIASALGIYHSTAQDVGIQQQIVDAARRVGQQYADGYESKVRRSALAEVRRDLSAYNLTRLISQTSARRRNSA